MNEAIATAGSSALVLDTAERTLGSEISMIERNATGVLIHDDESYAKAAEITKAIKQMQKKVKDFSW